MKDITLEALTDIDIERQDAEMAKKKRQMERRGKIVPVRIGDKVVRKFYGLQEPLSGVVIYIHPSGRYHTVEAAGIRQAFHGVDRDALQ